MKNLKTALFTSAIALCITATAPTIANAKDMYVSGQLGISSTSDADWSEAGINGDISLDGTVSFAGSLGMRYNENIRGEIELSYRNADLDQLSVDGLGSIDVPGELKTTTALLIGYYDFRAGEEFRPYISLGVGAAKHDVDIPLTALTAAAYSNDDTVLAGQLGAGASYAINDNTSLTGGYRWLTSKDMTFDGTSFDYDAHEIRFGLRYQF